jgi:hypothetical protein
VDAYNRLELVKVERAVPEWLRLIDGPWADGVVVGVVSWLAQEASGLEKGEEVHNFGASTRRVVGQPDCLLRQ